MQKQIFSVGGYVRDMLLGVPSQDRDYVVINSSQEHMLSLGFEQVGQGFPVFLHPETGDEYALARREKKTGVGYGGFSFDTECVTLEDDLSRRDLTINSMAMDDDGTIIDPFNGMGDLKNRVLRHTSEAFSEDPLRVIRLARFAARYTTFTIAPETMQLAKTVVASGELDALPYERFWAEIDKTMRQTGDASIFFEVLSEVGAFEQVKFFKDCMIPYQLGFVKAICEFDVEDRFSAFVVICCKNHRFSDEMKAQEFLKKCGKTAEDQVKAFGKIQAFSSGEKVFSFAMRAMTVVDPVHAAAVAWSYEAAKTVTADQAISAGMTGKDIGKWIFDKRVEAIHNVN